MGLSPHKKGKTHRRVLSFSTDRVNAVRGHSEKAAVRRREDSSRPTVDFQPPQLLAATAPVCGVLPWQPGWCRRSPAAAFPASSQTPGSGLRTLNQNLEGREPRWTRAAELPGGFCAESRLRTVAPGGSRWLPATNVSTAGLRNERAGVWAGVQRGALETADRKSPISKKQQLKAGKRIVPGKLAPWL